MSESNDDAPDIEWYILLILKSAAYLLIPNRSYIE